MENNCNHPLLVGVVKEQYIGLVTCCKCDEIGQYHMMRNKDSKVIFITNENQEEAYLESFLTRSIFKKRMLDKKNINIIDLSNQMQEEFVNHKPLQLIKTTSI
jgi:predicted adenine nucleotide alpha hydrolase (AANH) superfamily ATPase